MATNAPIPPQSTTTTIATATTATRVSRDQIEKAVNALLKWKSTKSDTQKPQLIPQDDYIYLNLTLKKIPQNPRTNPFKIPLSHHHHLNTTSQICLIIDDREKTKSKSPSLTSQTTKKIIKAQNIPISKVLKLSKLKTNYKPFESKRKLFDSYDVFFVDRRVLPLLPKLLGKRFFRKKKLPLRLDLTHKNWKEQIERFLSSGLLYLRTGTSNVVKVASVSMETVKIVDNVLAAVNGVVEVIPNKWDGVRSLHLKFSDSLALPVYQALPDMKLRIEGIKENEDKSSSVKEEENGSEVEVKKAGKKKGRIHEVRYMDVNNELGNDEYGNVGKKSEDKELGCDEFVAKKKKKGKIPSQLNGKKTSKVEKGDSDDDDENDDNKSEKDKKRKNGDSMRSWVLGEFNEKKRAKIIGKVDKGGILNQKKDELVVKGEEESAEKKAKKKIESMIKLKDGTQKKVKDKKSKKSQLVE